MQLSSLTDYIEKGKGTVLFRNSKNDKWYLLVDNGIGNDENKLFELVKYTDYRVVASGEVEVSKVRNLLCKQYDDNIRHKDTKEYLPNYMVFTKLDSELEQFVKYVLGENEQMKTTAVFVVVTGMFLDEHTSSKNE